MGRDLFSALTAAAAAGALVALLLRRWLRGLWAGARARRRAARAARGERDAEALLAAAGFVVEGRQVPLRWAIACDGAGIDVELRADLLVARDGRRYVAEVKTGEAAPRIEHPATRRQLLEYRVAYAADGVLLVDVEAGQVMEVEFPGAAGGAAPVESRWRWVLLGAVLGAGAAAVAARLLAGS